MSDPLSNGLFHFIDCDVKNEVWRLIMDGRRLQRKKKKKMAGRKYGDKGSCMSMPCRLHLT